MSATSMLWDLLLGLLGALLAYGIYVWTDSGLWTIACIGAYSVLFIWYRARDGE